MGFHETKKTSAPGLRTTRERDLQKGDIWRLCVREGLLSRWVKKGKNQTPKVKSSNQHLSKEEFSGGTQMTNKHLKKHSLSLATCQMQITTILRVFGGGLFSDLIVSFFTSDLFCF